MSMIPTTYVIAGCRLDPEDYGNDFYENLEILEEDAELEVIFSESEKVYYVGIVIDSTDSNNYMFKNYVITSEYVNLVDKVDRELDNLFKYKRCDVIVLSIIG